MSDTLFEIFGYTYEDGGFNESHNYLVPSSGASADLG